MWYKMDEIRFAETAKNSRNIHAPYFSTRVVMSQYIRASPSVLMALAKPLYQLHGLMDSAQSSSRGGPIALGI
jgi:hypothetical protein